MDPERDQQLLGDKKFQKLQMKNIFNRSIITFKIFNYVLMVGFHMSVNFILHIFESLSCQNVQTRVGGGGVGPNQV